MNRMGMLEMHKQQTIQKIENTSKCFYFIMKERSLNSLRRLWRRHSSSITFQSSHPTCVFFERKDDDIRVWVDVLLFFTCCIELKRYRSFHLALADNHRRTTQTIKDDFNSNLLIWHFFLFSLLILLLSRSRFFLLLFF
jgi:hypothetical protein